MPNTTVVSYTIAIAYAVEMLVFFIVALRVLWIVWKRREFLDRKWILTSLGVLLLLEGFEVALRLYVRGQYIVTGEVQVLGWPYVIASAATAAVVVVFYIVLNLRRKELYGE